MNEPYEKATVLTRARAGRARFEASLARFDASELEISRPPVGVVTHTRPPLTTPRSAATFGLISTNISCCSSASHGLERVSSPPPSYSTRRPELMISGNCLPMSLFFSCTLL